MSGNQKKPVVQSDLFHLIGSLLEAMLNRGKPNITEFAAALTAAIITELENAGIEIDYRSTAKLLEAWSAEPGSDGDSVALYLARKDLDILHTRLLNLGLAARRGVIEDPTRFDDAVDLLHLTRKTIDTPDAVSSITAVVLAEWHRLRMNTP
jgi:hypothetical protein